MGYKEYITYNST